VTRLLTVEQTDSSTASTSNTCGEGGLTSPPQQAGQCACEQQVDTRGGGVEAWDGTYEAKPAISKVCLAMTYFASQQVNWARADEMDNSQMPPWRLADAPTLCWKNLTSPQQLAPTTIYHSAAVAWSTRQRVITNGYLS